MEIRDIVTVILEILIACSLGFFSFSLVAWLRRMQIFKTWLAKKRGDIEEVEKLRQRQYQMRLQNDIFAPETEEKWIDKMYRFIAKTGITSHVMLSVTDIMYLYLIFIVLFFAVTALLANLVVGVIFTVAVILVSYILCNTYSDYQRRRIEAQMYDFINMCATASNISPNIVDIFGHIYEKVEAPLNGYLEECYNEAKQTHNNIVALEHLRQKSDSFMFQIIIDSFSTASAMNESYQEAVIFTL